MYSVRSCRSTSGRSTARPRSPPATPTTLEHVGTGPFTYGGRHGRIPDAPVEPAERLVGDEGARHEDADEVHRRHPQHVEHGVAAELPAEQDRPLEQLLPGHRQADRREGQHVLHEGAVHAAGEHGLARPEHDEGAAQRPSVPSCARDVDQRRPDRHRRLRQHRLEGEPDRPPADLEQVDRPGAGRKLGFKYNVAGAKALLAAERLQGHGRRRLRREQGRLGHQPAHHRPERLVGLDDRDPDHRRQRRRPPGSRSRRRTPTTTASSTSGTRASSTS